MKSLASTTGIVSISPVHALYLPDPFDAGSTTWAAPKAQSVNKAQAAVNATSSTNSSATVAASPVVTSSCSGRGRNQKCTTTTLYPSSSATAAPKPSQSLTGFSNLPQIQADRVHATGNRGQGVKIGVIDGGVDYTRPALGGCFGNGCKIAGGYDFVGDAYDGSNTPVPDADPFDNCYTHGTFTTGIIAAGDNEYNVTGVAPESSIYQYRVFGCNGASSDDIVIQAMQRAYQDNVDVINLSLGEVQGWTNGALSLVASRLTSRGVIVTSSAGNQGQVGAWYSYSPASGFGVINVGSTDNAIMPAQQLYTSSGYGPITYYNYQPFTMSPTIPFTPGQQYTYTAYTTDPNVAADGCTFTNTDLTGKVVVVRRGGCSLSDKARFAYQQGADAILVVNTPNTAPIQQNFPLINYGMIDNADGNYLLNQLVANNTVTLSFGFFPIVVPNTFSGNTTSYFSEIGPTNDLFFAPSVTAPGRDIIGVIPYNPSRFFFNWQISDGTSWSSAYAAGAAALYLNAKGGNVTPKSAKSAFENTATALPFSRSDSSLLSTAAQGSGKIQVFDAINTNLVVSPAELTLNDTANFNGWQYITLKNTGRSSVKYSLKHVPAGTMLSFGTGDYANQPNNARTAFDAPVPQVNSPASVWLSQNSVTVWPGFTAVVLAKFTPPSGLDAKQFPVYSGYIQITGGNNNVQVPYMGVAARMKDMPVIDGSSFAFGFPTPVVLNSTNVVQSGSSSYTFANGDAPKVIYRLTAGTASIVIDLVNVNASLGFTPNYNTRRALIGDELVARDVHEFAPRRILSSNDQTSTSDGLLGLWCKLTNNRGWGCQANGNGNTFNRVPVVGNLFENAYIARR